MKRKAMKKFKLRAMLLAVVLLCGGVSAFAFPYTTIWQDSIKYILYDDLTAYVGDAETDIKTANIPEKITYEGRRYTVMSIGSYAFSDCGSLTSVDIPSSVTSIRGGAFWGCSSLTSVDIPSSVTSIEDNVFGKCDSLFAYQTHNDLTATIFRVGNSLLLADASGKATYHIPPQITHEGKDYAVTSMGSGAFSYCSSLTSVDIPSSVTSIGSYAFAGCSSLDSVVIPSSVTSIGDFAFQYCSSLASVVIPNSVTSIGYNAFSGCSSLLAYRLNSDYTAYVYDAGDSILTANIPDKITYEGKDYAVTSIGYVFYGCSSLASVVIPSSVTSIGDDAFYGCSSLHSVTIGSGVQSIAASAFTDFNGYIQPEKVIWLGNTPPEGYKNVNGTYNYVSNDLFSGLSNTKVYPFLSSMFEKDGIKYVPNPSERTCDAIDCVYDPTAANINIGKTVNYKGVELAVKDIRPYTCYGNRYVKSVKVDYGRAIPQYAFYGCRKLEYAVLGESLKSMEYSAFEDCASLKGITIPDSVTGIGGRCFSGCESLAYAKIGAGVSVIPYRAFYSCKSLPEITIPKTVDIIDNNVFYGCTSLASVTIADRETELKLGSNVKSPMFSSCPLKSVYIGGNITYGTTAKDGYSPFYRNTSLETVRITDKETEISENEFYGCTSLKSVSMGDGIDTIGKYAFSGCSALESFSFGTGLKSIGDEAFSDCTGMKKLVSKTAVPPVCGPQALDDINKWECTLYVPQESLDAYKSAAQWKEFFFLETGIKDVPNTSSSATESARYSTDGTRIASQQKGINIIRMSDGTVKKVLVK